MMYSLVLLFCATVAFAQEQSMDSASMPMAVKNEVDYSTRAGLGFCGGATTGIGFAFRQHFASRWGIHIGAFGLGGSSEDYYGVDDEKITRSWLWLNIGAQGMYTLHRHKSGYFRLYTLAGGQVILNGDTPEEHYDTSTGTVTVTEGKWNIRPTYILGAGLGMEFLFAKHIGFSIELPLSVQIHEDGFRMYPIGNGTLIYFF